MRERLAGAARAALGGGRRLEAVERVTGGSKKGVYRLVMDDATMAIAYLWDDTENYWPAAEGDDDLTDPFSPGLGLDLFVAAHARLEALGVRVPKIRLIDREGAHAPADLAIVEDLPGANLEELLARDPGAAAPVMARLAESLEAMRGHRAPSYGKVAVVDSGGTSRGTSCEGVVVDRALRDLAEAASRDPRVAGARDRLEERLLGLAAAVRPRAEYAVVHGELGPDHVLVDADGKPVVIDIEGLMYFDVEWEHVFLRIRLHDAYRPLGTAGLDEDRLALYMLAQRLSLTAGPLRLLEGDFPDRAFMAGIAEYNLQQALELVLDSKS
ncbi:MULTISPECIES: phosphotransferase family protein [Streptomyces]|nr:MULTISPECIES: phosphotransferase [Streptomyces]KND42482.1 aminoglycoside phosphotransferase [Streptomyces stelliscabiei]MDX2514478.1 phosphotransferase [Streptomyces stelliscabiei]MDX2552257.1 phosphotransferase [Streptomyces stelliscabiei]MDX2611652.1 phosphotransferase [Streptomyces stelliscabiei]MDX2637001.1 phosphotransferase [Streptomyces stelliscabiei]